MVAQCSKGYASVNFQEPVNTINGAILDLIMLSCRQLLIFTY